MTKEQNLMDAVNISIEHVMWEPCIAMAIISGAPWTSRAVIRQNTSHLSYSYLATSYLVGHMLTFKEAQIISQFLC